MAAPSPVKPGRGAIALYVSWVLAVLAFMLPRVASAGAGFAVATFYTLIGLAGPLLVGLVAIRFKRPQELDELLSFDVSNAFPPMFIWGSITFLFLLVVYGLPPTFPSVDTLIFQAVVVVPGETFFFQSSIPRVFRYTSGRIFPLQGDPDIALLQAGIAAQVAFGLFHFVAFEVSIFQMLFATIFGIILFLLVWLGTLKTTAPARRGLLRWAGLGAAIAVHLIWNLFSCALIPQGCPSATTALIPPMSNPLVAWVLMAIIG